MTDVLAALQATLEQRKHASPEASYVAKLHADGLNKILEKVGEEATEVILAAKDCAKGGDTQALIHEIADLWFHNLVLLSHLNLSYDDVLDALASRMGQSGLAEKAARKSHNAASEQAET